MGTSNEKKKQKKPVWMDQTRWLFAWWLWIYCHGILDYTCHGTLDHTDWKQAQPRPDAHRIQLWIQPFSSFPPCLLIAHTREYMCVCVWSVLIRVTGRWCTSVDQATQLPENWNNCWERAGKDSSKWDSKRGTMYGPKCLVSCHELAHMRWWWSWGGWAERQSWKEQQSCGAAPMGISNTRAEVADGGGRSSAHPWIATRRRDFSSKVLLKLKCPKDICSSAENARTSCGISMISPLVVSPSVSCRCTLLWFCDRTASWDVNGRQEVSTKCSIPTKKTNQVWKTKVGRCQCRQAINVNWRPTRVIASCDVSMKLLILFCTCEDQSGQLT